MLIKNIIKDPLTIFITLVGSLILLSAIPGDIIEGNTTGQDCNKKCTNKKKKVVKDCKEECSKCDFSTGNVWGCTDNNKTDCNCAAPVVDTLPPTATQEAIEEVVDDEDLAALATPAEHFEKIIAIQQKALECDQACQDAKALANFKEIYEDDLSQLATLPAEFQVAEKNYLTAKEGDTYYNEYKNKQYTDAVDIEAAQKLTNFQTTVDTANRKIEYLKEQKKSLANIELLIERINLDIMKDVKQIKQFRKTVQTDERKVEYEDEKIDGQQGWDKFLSYIYLFILIILTIYLFLIKKRVKDIKTWTILLPLYLNYFFAIFNKLFLFITKKIKGFYNAFLPKDIYTNL